MPGLSDLTTPLSASTVLQAQLAFLALAGFPTTGWQSGSVPLTELQADAQTLASLSHTIANIAGGGLLQTAPALVQPGQLNSPWLALIALGHYGIIGKAPVKTIGLATLTDVAGAGPFTITPFQLIATTAAGLQYQNTTGGTLPHAGTLQLSWQAVSAGQLYNQANNSLVSLVTPLPGVTIANPDPGNGSQTWITQQGVDPESDTSIVLRCQGRWPGLGGGANTAVYTAWALTPTPGVTRVLVLPNTPQGGQVTIYCAGPSGGAAPADVTIVQNFINVLKPLTVTVNVLAASNVNITVAGTATVAAASLVAAQAQFSAAIAAYQQTINVGGTPLSVGGSSGVPLAQLIEIIQSLPGMQNVVLTSPTGDTVLAQNQIPVFTTGGLNFVPN